MIVRIANREDPDQTASSEAVWSGPAHFVYIILAGTWVKVQNFQNPELFKIKP